MGDLTRLRSRLGAAGLDGLLLTNAGTVRLLTGFTGSAATLLLSEHRTELLLDPRYVKQGRRETGLPVREFPKREQWLQAVVALCDSLGVVGAQAEHLTAAEWRALDHALPLTLRPADALVVDLVVQKRPSDVERLSAAASVSHRAVTWALGQLEEGMTERTLAAKVAYYLHEHADGLAFPIIAAFGPATADPHASPGDRRLAPGDLVLVDAGAKLAGWCGDVTITTVFGEPDTQQREYMDLTARALRAAEAAARVGATAAAVDVAARAPFEEAGLGKYTLRGVGHGVGLTVHESPRLVEHGTDRLENGHVFTLEPGLYLEGWGGIRLERTYALADDTLSPLNPWPQPQL